MSFVFEITGTKDAVRKALAADASLPDGVKDYVTRGVNALHAHTGDLFVKAFGHLHDGQPGNYETTSLTVTVKKAKTTAA